MTDRPQTITLDYLAQQCDKIIQEMAHQRADMAAMLVAARRLEANLSALNAELRALNRTIGRP